MFDIVSKADYWSWRKALDVDMGGGRGTLKGVQDTFILSQLTGRTGLKVLEMGGGASRVLPHLADTNECWNADKLEGVGDGPKRIPQSKGIKLVRAFVSEFSPELPDNYFDVVFSISVVEHVPDPEYADMIKDCARILKPGGMLIHAIDAYLVDPQDVATIGSYTKRRTEMYLKTPEISNGQLVWHAPTAIPAEIASSARHAVNQMDELYAWNTVAPSLTQLRLVAQNCSYKMILTKKI